MRTKKGRDTLLQAVFRQAGVPKPAVAYVGAASGDNAEFLLWLTGLMKESGAGRVMLAPLCGRDGDAEKAVKVLEASDLIFLSGGDVEEGMRVLRQKEMTAVLDRLHRAGKPFFAASAGSIMLARQWIRWEDPSDDESAVLFDCLGLAPVLCDTHGEDEGWEELKALLRLSPAGTVGHGIVSGSALFVTPAGTVSAVGGEIHRFRNHGGKVIRMDSLLPEREAP
jgi:cyanophycinase-like exopeptidase